MTQIVRDAALEQSTAAHADSNSSHQDFKRSNETTAQSHALVAEADVIIIGAGLAGSLAALVLARLGLTVVVIDRHVAYPAEFRCEKLNSAQLALLEELGVLDCLSHVTRAYNRILAVRGGRVTSIQSIEERGFTYSEMVNALRSAWPSEVKFFKSQVVDVITNPDRQQVILADESTIEARLVILATGLSNKLNMDLGFQRQMIHRAHTLCIGFDIALGNDACVAFESMTYFGERVGDRIAYATFFPTKAGMRVNLFSYHERHDSWAATFRQDPIGMLREAMPRLLPFLGDVRVVVPIQIRSIDLYETRKYNRDGIVLIGDAFRSSCPATGTGVTRVLTDVRQLCLIHLPSWFASAGMDADKISSFYNDERKLTCDRSAAHDAKHGRSLAIETNLRCRIKRALIFQAFRFKNIHERVKHVFSFH